VRPHEIPAARTPGPGEAPENDASRTTSRPVRVRHAARHARSSDARPRHRTSLSIRSAERRRWAADLTGPGSGGLVIYGMGGIGKSTLAVQIATRVNRLQSGRVVTVVNGELPASAPGRPRRTSSSWRLTAGHPLAVEYLDLLLARGESYQDLAGRIEAAITAGTDVPRTEPTELPDATAERIASAAGDLMFGDLLGRLGTAARSLLIRASVFRVPVTAEALAARPGPIAECEAAGLLTIGPGHELGVHRWTAGALHRRLAKAGLGARLAAAHRQAAAYWLSRGGYSPETGYHQRQAAELTRVAGPARARAPACAAAVSRSRWPPRPSRWRWKLGGPWPPPTSPPPRRPPARSPRSRLPRRPATRPPPGWLARSAGAPSWPATRPCARR
jgi:hypothetical protein